MNDRGHTSSGAIDTITVYALRDTCSTCKKPVTMTSGGTAGQAEVERLVCDCQREEHE